MVPVTVQRALSLVARRHPAKVALRQGSHTLTYAQLDERATRLARALRQHGVGRGERVGVLLPNCTDYVVTALACAKATVCMVPVNYRFTREEIQRQLADCDARALIFDEGFAEQAARAAADAGVSVLLCRSEQPQLPANAANAIPLEAAIADAPSALMLEEAEESDAFYLGYTSGTTGRPKGAIVTQRNRALAYHYWALEFGIGPDDVALHCGPFHHTAPFTFTLTQLFMGGEVVILDAFDGVAAVQAMRQHKVTWAFAVPFMLDRLLEASAGQADADAAGSLRMLISGASPLPTRTKEEVLKRFAGVALHEFYGATEAGVVTNLRPADQFRKVRCVGQPVADIEIAIRGDNGAPLAPGAIGDIWLRGPTLFAGYFKAPDKTAEAMDGDWCTLGDIGRMDEEGYLYLVDRRKDVIKSGGVNIYPIEIEEVLMGDPSVRECAVVGLPDERWGEAVHAFIVLAAGQAEADALGRLQSQSREQLAGYKQPRTFHFVEALPRNANGKVLKRELREHGLVKPAGSG